MIGYDFNKKTPYDQDMVCFLEKLLLMDIHEILNKEGDSKSLEVYLRECLYLLLYCLSFYTLLIFFPFVFLICRTNDAFIGTREEEVLG